MKDSYKPSSAVAPYIEGLLSEKRALGYDYRSEELILYRFDRYCIENSIESDRITKHSLGNWMKQTEKESAFNQGKRISVVRQLLLYMAGHAIPVYIPHDFCHFEKKIPHILTQEEVKAVFEAIDAYLPGGSGAGNRNLIRLSNEYRVLFRMIYLCGLRNSEAAGIGTQEVDLDKGILTILNAKGKKDRLVYMAEDLTCLCRDYHSYLVDELGYQPEWFFPALDPTNPLRNTTVDMRFAEAWKKTGFAACCNNKPVVHDLRFTFVTKRLNRWVEEGRDINALMPYLSMYLGHKSISETHYYYHLTMEALKIAHKKDTVSARVIPGEAVYE